MLGETGNAKNTQIGEFLVKERWMARQRVSVTSRKGMGMGMGMESIKKLWSEDA